jgi:centromeric protein E
MAASLPRPSRPSFGPPTTALPALPSKKTRKSTGGIHTTPELLSSDSIPSLPKSALRAPSTSSLPTTPGGGGSLPKMRAVSGVNGAGKSIRKTISINAFPQPPRSGPGGIRTTSLPPSPLSGGLTPANVNPYAGTRRESTESSPLTPGGKLRKKAKPANSPNTQSYVGNTTPSLLNGSGDSRSISSGPGARGSDGLLSLPSPPQSRSSSAQDSYSTSATTYDDNGEGTRGRETSAEHNDNRSSKPPEGKGNVIVSVRVRPDAGTTGSGGKSDGDWMIDGRKSLVSYRGKEAGEYYYGKQMRLYA